MECKIKKAPIFFLAGAAVGAICGYGYCRVRYEKKTAEEIEAIREYYKKKNEKSEEPSEEDSEDDTDDPKETWNNTVKKIIEENQYNNEYAVYPEDNPVVADILDEERIEKEEEERKNGPAYEVISYDEFGDGTYDTAMLTWYVVDQVLASEEDEMISNVLPLVGNLLSETGFDTDGEGAIYIRNHVMGIDYEIIKVDCAYK